MSNVVEPTAAAAAIGSTQKAAGATVALGVLSSAVAPLFLTSADFAPIPGTTISAGSPSIERPTDPRGACGDEINVVNLDGGVAIATDGAVRIGEVIVLATPSVVKAVAEERADQRRVPCGPYATTTANGDTVIVSAVRPIPGVGFRTKVGWTATATYSSGKVVHDGRVVVATSKLVAVMALIEIPQV